MPMAKAKHWLDCSKMRRKGSQQEGDSSSSRGISKGELRCGKVQGVPLLDQAPQTTNQIARSVSKWIIGDNDTL